MGVEVSMTDDLRRYAIVPLDAGPAPAEAIVVGGLNDVLSYLPQTVARESRERRLAEAEADLARRADSFKLRAEDVIERERQADEQLAEAKAIQSEAIRRFAGDVLKIRHQFDAIEQRQLQARLDALPDPDSPHADNFQAVLEAPGPEDRERLEAMEAEEERDDQGALPPDLKEAAPTGNFANPEPIDDPVTGSPSVSQPTVVSLTSADSTAVHDDGYVCRRDRRAARKRQRLQSKKAR
jgi:hypothetical protein